MHKQNKTNREVGLENIMESMYGRTSEGRLSRGRLANPDGTECDHCKGTGHHHDDKGNQTECEMCGGDGWIDKKDTNKYYKQYHEGDDVCPKCGKVHTINAGCGKPHSEDTSHYVNKEADDDARHWDDPNPAADSPLNTSEVLGQVYKEIEAYMDHYTNVSRGRRSVTGQKFTTGADDLKTNVLAIVNKYMADNPEKLAWDR